MTTAFYAHTDTPDGPFTVIVSDGAVLGSGWTSDPKDLLPRIHQSLLPSALEKSDTEAEFALDAVRKYYDGDFAAVLRTPVRQVSGEFRAATPGTCYAASVLASALRTVISRRWRDAPRPCGRRRVRVRRTPQRCLCPATGS